MEVWPVEIIQEGLVDLPWYGSRERWLCVALNKHVNLKEPGNRVEMEYAACWLEDKIWEKKVKVYKITKEQEEDKKETTERRWDPLDCLPPPPPLTSPVVYFPSPYILPQVQAPPPPA